MHVRSTLRRATGPLPRCAGFTIVEIAVAAALLVVGLLGLVASIAHGARLVGTNRETAVAHEAARAMAERVQATDFAVIFATFNSAPGDDPGGAGTAPGPSFAVVGLDPQAGDADGAVGEILFPTVGGLGLQLTENVVDAGWGMPRDLDADGAPEAGPIDEPYVMLPVRIRLRWRGQNGDRQLELVQLLIDR